MYLPTAQATFPRLTNLLKVFGVQPREFDVHGSDVGMRGYHSMGYGFVREAQFAPGWFTEGTGASKNSY